MEHGDESAAALDTSTVVGIAIATGHTAIRGGDDATAAAAAAPAATEQTPTEAEHTVAAHPMLSVTMGMRQAVAPLQAARPVGCLLLLQRLQTTHHTHMHAVAAAPAA